MHAQPRRFGVDCDGRRAGSGTGCRTILTAARQALGGDARIAAVKTFSGVYSSIFFARPTAVVNPRKVDIGMTFQV